MLTFARQRPQSQRVVTFSLLLLIAVAMLAATPGRALAGPNEGDFFGAANSARSAAGLPGYTYAGDLAAAGRAQAERMAASGQLEHNPNLGGSVSNWQGLAENVGVGTDWGTIQQALMNSPEHRAAILDSGYTQMGVGTAVDKDGTLWVSEVFRLPAGASVPAPGAGSSSDAIPSATGGSTTSTVSRYPNTDPDPAVEDSHAREQVGTRRNHHGSSDPLVAAFEYSTVMKTVGS